MAATVGFRAIGAGDPQIRVESIDGRNLRNGRIDVPHGARVNNQAIPRVTALLNPSPNPFNPSTTLYFSVAERGRVELAVYSAGGRKVRTLLAEVREPGLHQQVWNGTDDRGNRVASGKYFVRFTAGNVVSSRALVMVK